MRRTPSALAFAIPCKPLTGHELQHTRSAPRRARARSGAHRRGHSRCGAFFALAALSLSVACSDTLRPLSPSALAAADRAQQLFDGLAWRYTNVERNAKYEMARQRLTQAALVPSRVFDDSATWTGKPLASARILQINGSVVDGHYLLAAQPLTTPPMRPGDTRHSVMLTRVGDSQYRWDTSVDFGIGSMSADGVQSLFEALVGVAQSATERELRADYATAFPRAAAAFGRGFSIDTLHLAPGAAGSTSVTLTVGFHADAMRGSFPDFAQYLEKYLSPARYRLTLMERSGTPIVDVVGRDRTLTLKYRVQHRQLVSLYGPPRPMPDSLLLRSEAAVKIKMFTVGFHNLVSEFVVTSAPHERAWSVISQREPQWDLPLITERLLRTPLRRPFEGQGSLFTIGIRDSAGMQSVLSRRMRLEVQESAIMRFIGSLGARAVDDLDYRVEVQEDRFLREGFAAMARDAQALGPRWLAEKENATGQ